MTRSPIEGRVIARYAAFQLPELLLVATLLFLAHEWHDDLPAWVAPVVLGVWVLKDAVMFPFVRKAYERSGDHSRPLDGQLGVAQDSLSPQGYVRVASELWRAECVEGSESIHPGDRVRVRETRGFTLIVERVEKPPELHA